MIKAEKLLQLFLLPILIQSTLGCMKANDAAVQQVLAQDPVSKNKVYSYQPETIECLDNDNLPGFNKDGSGECYDMSLQNFEESNFKGVNLRGANLKESNLKNANLEDADLTGANLTSASLEGANLKNTKLIDAKIKGTLLETNTPIQPENESSPILPTAPTPSPTPDPSQNETVPVSNTPTEKSPTPTPTPTPTPSYLDANQSVAPIIETTENLNSQIDDLNFEIETSIDLHTITIGLLDATNQSLEDLNEQIETLRLEVALKDEEYSIVQEQIKILDLKIKLAKKEKPPTTILLSDLNKLKQSASSLQIERTQIRDEIKEVLIVKASYEAKRKTINKETADQRLVQSNARKKLIALINQLKKHQKSSSQEQQINLLIKSQLKDFSFSTWVDHQKLADQYAQQITLLNTEVQSLQNLRAKHKINLSDLAHKIKAMHSYTLEMSAQIKASNDEINSLVKKLKGTNKNDLNARLELENLILLAKNTKNSLQLKKRQWLGEIDEIQDSMLPYRQDIRGMDTQIQLIKDQITKFKLKQQAHLTTAVYLKKYGHK